MFHSLKKTFSNQTGHTAPVSGSGSQFTHSISHAAAAYSNHLNSLFAAFTEMRQAIILLGVADRKVKEAFRALGAMEENGEYRRLNIELASSDRVKTGIVSSDPSHSFKPTIYLNYFSNLSKQRSQAISLLASERDPPSTQPVAAGSALKFPFLDVKYTPGSENVFAVLCNTIEKKMLSAIRRELEQVARVEQVVVDMTKEDEETQYYLNKLNSLRSDRDKRKVKAFHQQSNESLSSAKFATFQYQDSSNESDRYHRNEAKLQTHQRLLLRHQFQCSIRLRKLIEIERLRLLSTSVNDCFSIEKNLAEILNRVAGTGELEAVLVAKLKEDIARREADEASDKAALMSQNSQQPRQQQFTSDQSKRSPQQGVRFSQQQTNNNEDEEDIEDEEEEEYEEPVRGAKPQPSKKPTKRAAPEPKEEEEEEEESEEPRRQSSKTAKSSSKSKVPGRAETDSDEEEEEEIEVAAPPKKSKSSKDSSKDRRSSKGASPPVSHSQEVDFLSFQSGNPKSTKKDRFEIIEIEAEPESEPEEPPAKSKKSKNKKGKKKEVSDEEEEEASDEYVEIAPKTKNKMSKVDAPDFFDEPKPAKPANKSTDPLARLMASSKNKPKNDSFSFQSFQDLPLLSAQSQPKSGRSAMIDDFFDRPLEDKPLSLGADPPTETDDPPGLFHIPAETDGEPVVPVASPKKPKKKRPVSDSNSDDEPPAELKDSKRSFSKDIPSLFEISRSVSPPQADLHARSASLDALNDQPLGSPPGGPAIVSSPGVRGGKRNPFSEDQPKSQSVIIPSHNTPSIVDPPRSQSGTFSQEFLSNNNPNAGSAAKPAPKKILRRHSSSSSSSDSDSDHEAASQSKPKPKKEKPAVPAWPPQKLTKAPSQPGAHHSDSDEGQPPARTPAAKVSVAPPATKSLFGEDDDF